MRSAYGQRTTVALDSNGSLASLTNPAGERTQLTTASTGLLSSLTEPGGGVHHFTFDTLGLLVTDVDAAGHTQSLSHTDPPGGGHTVSISNPVGLTTTYSVAQIPTGGQRYVTTFPAGTHTDAVVGADGTQTSAAADGTIIQAVFA